MTSGTISLLLVVWLECGFPLLLDRLVVEAHTPTKADAIVCIAGGIGPHLLPTDEGWNRIYTAVQLQADGYAPIIVFSGGGTAHVSEAEVYAEGARWLGCPADAMVLDPTPSSTVEHPRSLLRLNEAEASSNKGLRIRRDTPLLVVTSRLHSRRTALEFRKAGFTHVRVVVDYEAQRAGVSRSARRSAVEAFRPSGRRYDDPVNRLRWGLDRLLVTARELGAIAVSSLRGEE